METENKATVVDRAELSDVQATGDLFDNSFNLNYTSVFSYFTNEVISECTPDRGFSTRIMIRLDAVKGVYGAASAFIAAIDKDKGSCEIVFTDMEDRTGSDRLLGREDRASTERFLNLDVSAFDGLHEDVPVYFVGGGVLRDVKEAWDANDLMMVLPFIETSSFLWMVIIDRPTRFLEYTLSLTLAGNAIKTEVSKRLMLEEIAGGETSSLRLNVPTNSIYIKMLGTFQLKINGKTIDCYDIGGRQCAIFLANLLLYRRRLISTQEITELLLRDGEVDNPKNTIKSVVFRIRKAFKPYVDDDIVITRHGSYMLNPKFKFNLDISRFELYCSMAKRKTTSELERLALLEYAIKLYKGDMLPGLESETTFLGRITYYRLLFDSALENYFAILLKNQRYIQLFRTVANLTAQTCLSSRVHVLLVKALVAMGRQDLARSYIESLRDKGIFSQADLDDLLK